MRRRSNIARVLVVFVASWFLVGIGSGNAIAASITLDDIKSFDLSGTIPDFARFYNPVGSSPYPGGGFAERFDD
jgi:hypothetical protein